MPRDRNFFEDFWGLNLVENNVLYEAGTHGLHVTMAVLLNDTPGMCASVRARCCGKDFLLCRLKADGTDQQSLNLKIKSGRYIQFYKTGQGKVDLTGYQHIYENSSDANGSSSNTSGSTQYSSAVEDDLQSNGLSKRGYILEERDSLSEESKRRKMGRAKGDAQLVKNVQSMVVSDLEQEKSNTNKKRNVGAPDGQANWNYSIKERLGLSDLNKYSRRNEEAGNSSDEVEITRVEIKTRSNRKTNVRGSQLDGGNMFIKQEFGRSDFASGMVGGNAESSTWQVNDHARYSGKRAGSKLTNWNVLVKEEFDPNRNLSNKRGDNVKMRGKNEASAKKVRNEDVTIDLTEDTDDEVFESCRPNGWQDFEDKTLGSGFSSSSEDEKIQRGGKSADYDSSAQHLRAGSDKLSGYGQKLCGSSMFKSSGDALSYGSHLGRSNNHEAAGYGEMYGDPWNSGSNQNVAYKPNGGVFGRSEGHDRAGFRAVRSDYSTVLSAGNMDRMSGHPDYIGVHAGDQATLGKRDERSGFRQYVKSKNQDQRSSHDSTMSGYQWKHDDQKEYAYQDGGNRRGSLFQRPVPAGAPWNVISGGKSDTTTLSSSTKSHVALPEFGTRNGGHYLAPVRQIPTSDGSIAGMGCNTGWNGPVIGHIRHQQVKPGSSNTLGKAAAFSDNSPSTGIYCDVKEAEQINRMWGFRSIAQDASAVPWTSSESTLGNATSVKLETPPGFETTFERSQGDGVSQDMVRKMLEKNAQKQFMQKHRAQRDAVKKMTRGKGKDKDKTDFSDTWY